MQNTSILRQRARSVAIALLFLVCVHQAHGADTYSGGQLSIPAVAVGSATFTNMVVTPLSIIRVQGGTANGNEDTYDPTSNQLTIPAVVYEGTTYTNVVITVGTLVSVASVTGADVFNGADLIIPSVQVGGSVYNNVVITVGKILGAGGGMPKSVRDVYNLASGELTIAAVEVDGTVYTNAIITAGSIKSIGNVAVPNVVDLTQAAATTAIEVAGLTVGTVGSATSASVPAGSVISESPEAGASVVPGSAVNLTVSLGASVPTGTGVGWFPFVATAVTGASPAGQTGLFVVPNTPLADSGANVSWVIANTPVQAIGTAFVADTGTQGVGYWPYEEFYAALDSNNVVQLYAVNLTNASSKAPAATTIGNFAARQVTSLAQICDHKSVQTNIFDPTSWFIVLHIGGSSGCGTSTATGDAWVVVTASTTTPVNITTTSFDQLYNPSGVLVGMVLHDPATNNLYLYANSSFTNPTTLFTNAQTDVTVYARSGAKNAATAIGTVEFRALGTSAGAAQALYRLDYTGAATFTAVPTYSPGSDLLSSANKIDNVNVYFTDTNTKTGVETLYQEPIGTGGSATVAPVALYSASNSPGFTVIGANTSVVVLATGTSGNPQTSTLETVPVGVAGTATPTPLGTFNGSTTSTQLLGDSVNNYSDGALYVNVRCSNTNCLARTEPDSAEILAPNGTILEALASNSVFLLESGILDGYVLEIKGVTDTSGATEGGGTLYDVPTGDNISAFLGYPFSTCLTFSGITCTQTGNFVLPANSLLPAIASISTNFGEGIIEISGAPASGVVANLNQQEIGIVTLTNSTISFGY